MLLLSACFTGIEGTKRIELGREDRKETVPTPEENYLSEIKSKPLKEWPKGKIFIVTDSRLEYALEKENPYIETKLHPGDTLCFADIAKKRMPDGREQIIIRLQHIGSNEVYSYSTGLPAGEAEENFISSRMPMLIDIELVEDTDHLLCGKELYTLTGLWYDDEGHRIQGLKYKPVKIERVIPGNNNFPLLVKFSTETGEKAGMYMNIGNDKYDSRSFSTLFSLSDVRKKHPSVSEQKWQLICNSQVTAGMTKEECRLAIGAPSDVTSGHDYSQTLDIWQYPDGKYLRFVDGILTDFRI